MPTFLHDLSALQSLAEGPPGAARDWANLRLVLRDPERVRHLPERPREASQALASGLPLLKEQLLERVRQAHPTAGTLVETMSAAGLLPLDDPGPWIEPVRALGQTDSPDQRVTVAETLANLGVYDEALISSLSKDSDIDVQIAASALILRWVEHQGKPLDDLAKAMGQGLLALSPFEPGLYTEVLVRLGLPAFVSVESIEEAAAVGTELAHGELQPVPTTGSTRSRARRYVRQLLGGRKGAAEQLLLAMAELEVPDPADLVLMASWCAHQPSQRYGAVQSVLFGGGEDRVLLAQARAQLRTAEAPLVAIQVLGARLASNPVVSLVPALPLQMREAEEMLPAALDHRLYEHGDERSKLVMPYVLQHERLPDALRARDPMALARAAFAQTEEVLAALLEYETDRPDERVALAYCLAQQADAAAYDKLQQLASEHEDLQDALELGGLLLGRTR